MHTRFAGEDWVLGVVNERLEKKGGKAHGYGYGYELSPQTDNKHNGNKYKASASTSSSDVSASLKAKAKTEAQRAHHYCVVYLPHNLYDCPTPFSLYSSLRPADRNNRNNRNNRNRGYIDNNSSSSSFSSSSSCDPSESIGWLGLKVSKTTQCLELDKDKDKDNEMNKSIVV